MVIRMFILMKALLYTCTRMIIIQLVYEGYKKYRKVTLQRTSKIKTNINPPED
jgi:hypothetical protein